MRNLILVGAATEAVVVVLALVGPGGGVMAVGAALIGTAVAFAAQLTAVALLRPAMGAKTPLFFQRFGLGIAVRFGSFVVLAALMVTLRTVFPISWMAAGYLGMLLVLLFGETRFLT